MLYTAYIGRINIVIAFMVDSKSCDCQRPYIQPKRRKSYIQPKRESCSKSAAGLLPFSHQTDIRMRSHRLLRPDDNKSAAICQQAWCKLIVMTFYPQAWCKLFQQLIVSLQISSCTKSDFHRLGANWWREPAWCTELNDKLAWNPQIASSPWRFYLCVNSCLFMHIQGRFLHACLLLKSIMEDNLKWCLWACSCGV